MIASLKGKLIRKHGDYIVVDVSGVGYRVQVSSSLMLQVGEIGSDITVEIYTDVRENSISLFGFSQTAEKEVFLLLKKVKGVGSKLALTVVSWIPIEELLQAISTANVSVLQGIPGIGKKTAERLIVELREQVAALARDNGTSLSSKVTIIRGAAGHRQSNSLPMSVTEDAVLALEKLGFSQEKARNAVSITLSEQSSSNPSITEDAGELVKQALANL